MKKANKNILLFRPPYRHLGGLELFDQHDPPPVIPMGIASIASAIECNSDIKCEVYYSGDYTKRAIEEILLRMQPLVIGISCESFNRFACIEISEIAKKVNKNIIIIFGGIHATILDKQLLENYQTIDFIIRGEGEETFLELLSKIKDVDKIKDVLGISFRMGNIVIRNPDHPFIKNLDTLPPLRYSKFSFGSKSLSLNKDKYYLADSMPIETARGCPYHCTYCSSVGFWRQLRREKSIERVIYEIKTLVKKYKKKMIFFHDLVFTINDKRVKDFCKSLHKNKLEIEWVCSTKPELVSGNLLKLMKESGCQAIFYGVESLSSHILRSIGRCYDVELMAKNINLTQEIGIKTHINLILGFPAETENTLRGTLRELYKINSNIEIVVRLLQNVPGSKLYQDSVKDGFDESFWIQEHLSSLPFCKYSIPINVLKSWQLIFEKLRNRINLRREGNYKTELT